MIRSVIIDDERKSRNTLSTLLGRYCSEVSVAADAGNIPDAVNVIDKFHPQLIFLDISMPDGTGFDLLDKLPSAEFEVIFTTAYSEYAMQAIKTQALDYLLKPINIKELQNAVQKAEVRLKEKQELKKAKEALKVQQQKNPLRVAVPHKKGMQLIDVKDIVHLQAKGSYTQLYCNDKSTFISSKSMKDFEELLPSGHFFRVHHSHIINLDQVVQYYRGDGGYVVMMDGSKVDISKRRKKSFLELFNG